MTTARTNPSLARAIAALVVLFVAVARGPAFAKDKGEWNVSGHLIGKVDKDTGDDTNHDMSGIACAANTGFPRTCVVVDDELQAAQVVTVTDGTIAAGDLIPLTHDMFDNKPVELDGEGVAFADGFFYVIGSHGRPRRDKKAEDQAKEDARIAARFAASSKLIRFKLDGTRARELAVSTDIAKLIAAEPLFDRYRVNPLEENGITVEGIAVLGQRLFVGFRGPAVGKHNSRAVIMSAALGRLFEGEPAAVKLHRLKLGGHRGVRDLAAFDNGILILAGPVKSERGTYSVLWWDGASDKAKWLDDLPDYMSKKKKGKKRKQWKPEALLPLDNNKKSLRILLLLDGPKNGMPREERVPYP